MHRLWAAGRQAWWAPLALLLVVSDIAVGVAIILEDQNPGSLVGGVLHIAGGIAIVVGLLMRSHDRRIGNVLILFGAFWGLPLFWLVVPPLLAIAVAVGVIASGFSTVDTS